MAKENDTISCAITSWIVAAVAGLILAAILIVLADWSFMQGAFAGVIAAVILGFILSQFMCSEGTAKSDLEAVRNGSKGAAARTAEAKSDMAASSAAAATAAAAAGTAATTSSAHTGGATAAAASASTSAATASDSFEMQPTKPLAGEAELAARKGEWKYERAPEAKKASAKKSPAKKAPAKKAASTTASAKPKRAPVAPDGKPETLKAARAGGPDDLKLISGVGPKLEGMLNTMGFWHFDQVASWRKKEVQWVNDNLEGFKGRIERDDWVSQAKVLAKGGETEFSKKKKK